MLDYMNQNEEDSQDKSVSLQEVLSESEDDIDNHEQEEVGGEFENEDQEYLTTSVEKSSVKRSTVMLVCLFAVGAISIFLMVKNTGPQTAGAQATAQADEIDLAIAKLSGIKAEIFSKMDGIAKKFDELSSIEQIKVGNLQRNPFSLQTAVSSRIGASSISSNVTNSYFALDSIIQSDNGNLCMIDGQVYQEGDSVGGFTVARVEKDQVVLQANGEVKILKIDMQ